MSRFFKSALFPILIVLLLAFFAMQLFDNQNEEKYTYGEFISQVEAGQVKSA